MKTNDKDEKEKRKHEEAILAFIKSPQLMRAVSHHITHWLYVTLKVKALRRRTEGAWVITEIPNSIKNSAAEDREVSIC